MSAVEDYRRQFYQSYHGVRIRTPDGSWYYVSYFPRMPSPITLSPEITKYCMMNKYDQEKILKAIEEQSVSFIADEVHKVIFKVEARIL